MTLNNFGWTDADQTWWDGSDQDGLQPARVVADYGTSLKIVSPEPMTAELSGKLAHYTDREQMPKVGDWVAARVLDSGDAIIETVVLRHSEIARKVAGRRALKQIVAANVDVAFVLLALDDDFSVERLKRFLYQLSINSVAPVIVLNKADKTDDVQSFVAQLDQLGLPIVISTASHGLGIDEIRGHIRPGQTAILLGSSGVGKSTVTNQLLGRDAQATNEVRESDSTGVHTTVHRELFVLPGGGLLIDSPGVREFQLWGTEEDLDKDYEDVVALVRSCKYTTCQHSSEAGCAVQAALQDGTLEAKHYAGYVKMKIELTELATRTTNRARHVNRRQRAAKNVREATIDYENS